MNLEKSLRIFSDPALLEEIKKHGRLKHLSKGDLLIRPGNEVQYVPIILSGSVRILRQDDNGQEVFLYHLYPGQTCAMSLACCQSGKKSMVKGLAESDTDVLLVPVKMSDDWLQYAEWKTYISGSYTSRFSELMHVIDVIAFQNMDKQLLRYLEERCKALDTRILDITHQQIADELHAHREAISRLLRVMEQKKLVRLGRNNIEVLTLK